MHQKYNLDKKMSENPTLHDTVRYIVFLCGFGLLSCKLLQHAHMSVYQPRLQMNLCSTIIDEIEIKIHGRYMPVHQGECLL